MAEVVPGYPIPVDADAEEFPYGDAALVNHWAHKAGNSVARKLLDEIRDCLGHPDRVLALAEAWHPTASAPIRDAKEGLLSARAELKAYWEGQAFAAFSGYVDHVIKVIDDTCGVMTGMRDLVLDYHQKITETYAAGIRFIGTCAQAILDGAATFAQDWKNLWGAVCEAILVALSKFTGAVTDLMIETNRILSEYREAGVKLKGQAAALQVPDPISPAIGESGNWKVHKAGT